MDVLPGLDIRGLKTWMQRSHPEIAAPDMSDLSVSLIAGGRSNLTYSVDGASVPLILRRPPLGHVLSSAHDMRREHRVISALAESPVPVPIAVDLVDDSTDREVTGTAFFFMERSPGQVLSRTTENQRYTARGLHSLSLELARYLADLHSVDPESVGLGDFGRPGGYLARQLATWARQLDASRSRATPALDTLQSLLTAGIPESSRGGIVHGDYRLDNALVVGSASDPHISAILDWEMATLGDPLVDLGMLSVYWHISELPVEFASAVPSAVDADAGYPAFSELVDTYARQAGIKVPDLRWYEAFASYKLAVILEGIHYRYQSGGTVGEGFDRIGALVEPLAHRGLEIH